MEILGFTVLALMFAVVVWLVVLSIQNPIVAVADELTSPRTPEAARAGAFPALAEVEATSIEQSSPGQMTVVLERHPGWTLLLAVLLFPIGLLFLFIREDLRLDVTVSEAAGGSAIRVSGRTRKKLAERVGARLLAATT